MEAVGGVIKWESFHCHAAKIRKRSAGGKGDAHRKENLTLIVHLYSIIMSTGASEFSRGREELPGELSNAPIFP